MSDNSKKLEAISLQIEQLKKEQLKVQQEMLDDMLEVLKHQEFYQYDMNVLVGGLLEVISTINSDSNKDKLEAWRAAGENFRKPKTKKTSKKERVASIKN